MAGGGTPPTPPPMSADENALVGKQSEALDLYLNQIKGQAGQNQEVSNLYKKLSGLYTYGDVPTEIDALDIDKYNQAMQQDIDKQNVWNKGEIKKNWEDQLARWQGDPELRDAKRYGYTKKQASTEKGYALDESAVGKLREEQKKYQDVQNAIAQENAAMTLRALKGELPVSAATALSKERDFGALREQLGRMGHRVEGGDLDQAVGTSSAGIENLRALKTQYGLQEDAERHGQINQGFGRSFAVSPGMANTANATGAVGYGPMATGGAYPSLAAGYGSMMNPFQQQRQLEMQSSLLGYQANAQKQAGIYSLFGNLLGAGTTAMILGGGGGGGASAYVAPAMKTGVDQLNLYGNVG